MIHADLRANGRVAQQAAISFSEIAEHAKLLARARANRDAKEHPDIDLFVSKQTQEAIRVAALGYCEAIAGQLRFTKVDPERVPMPFRGFKWESYGTFNGPYIHVVVPPSTISDDALLFLDLADLVMLPEPFVLHPESHLLIFGVTTIIAK